MMDISSLVGLPWHDRNCNCLTLAARAQRDLWGREVDVSFAPSYSPEGFFVSTDRLAGHLVEYADRIGTPEPGAVGIFVSCGCGHLATFVTEGLVLYILVGRLSRLSPYTRAWRARMASLWRLRG